MSNIPFKPLALRLDDVSNGGVLMSPFRVVSQSIRTKSKDAPISDTQYDETIFETMDGFGQLSRANRAVARATMEGYIPFERVKLVNTFTAGKNCAKLRTLISDLDPDYDISYKGIRLGSIDLVDNWSGLYSGNAVLLIPKNSINQARLSRIMLSKGMTLREDGNFYNLNGTKITEREDLPNNVQIEIAKLSREDANPKFLVTSLDEAKRALGEDKGTSEYDCLYGGAAYEYIIRNYDYVSLIRKFVDRKVAAALKSGVNVPDQLGDTWSIQRDSVISKEEVTEPDALQIIGNWYIEPTWLRNNAPAGINKPSTEVMELVQAEIKNHFVTGESSVLSAALNNISSILAECRKDGIPLDEARVEANRQFQQHLVDTFLMEGITVLPIGLRPKVDGRHDKLHYSYEYVIASVIELSALTIRLSPTPYNILHANGLLGDTSVQRGAYAKLQESVYYLISAADNGMKYESTELTSIRSTLKGKHGHVRSRLLSKRADYTGRTVIVPDPYLTTGEVGVPEKMLWDLYFFYIHSRAAYVEHDGTNWTYNPNKEITVDPDDFNGSETDLSTLSPEELMDHMERLERWTAGSKDRVVKSRRSAVLKIRDHEERMQIIRAMKLTEEIPCVIGRQPTLHKLGIQGYKVVPVKGKAIRINALSCPGYNADFDGDTMHISIPIREESVKEIWENMIASKNIFHPKSGEPNYLPRHEMVYGLMKDMSKVGKASERIRRIDRTIAGYEGQGIITLEKFKEEYHASVQEGKVIVSVDSILAVIEYNTRVIFNAAVGCAGYTEKMVHIHVIEDYLKAIVTESFEMSRLTSPTIDILTPIANSHEKKEAKDRFCKNMAPIYSYFADGFESEEGLAYELDKYRDEFDKEIKKFVEAGMVVNGVSHGFKELSDSGARAKASNLVQIFGGKGAVLKNSDEVFLTLIFDAYCDQMSPLDAFVAAFGALMGLIDKTINVGRNGYTTRKMQQAASSIIIDEYDCGTTEGLELTVEDAFLALGIEYSAKESSRPALLRTIIESCVGRYILGVRDTEGVYHSAESFGYDNMFWGSEKELRDIAGVERTEEIEAITIRSPMYCKGKCCQKCYGTDLELGKVLVSKIDPPKVTSSSEQEKSPSIRAEKNATPRAEHSKLLPPINSHVGFIAAQAIGEPGTQATMRTFHSGGVAGATSASGFAKLEAYLDCTNLAKSTKFSMYEPVAWRSGPTKVTPIDRFFNEVTIEGSTGKEVVLIYSHVRIKSYVEKGEGLFLECPDNRSIKEVEKYAGVEAARRYLLHTLFRFYVDTAGVNLKHFEVLVNSMTFYWYAGEAEGKVGQFVRAFDVCKDDPALRTSAKRILSCKNVSIKNSDGLSVISLEDIGRGITRAVLNRNPTNVENPISRIILGLGLDAPIE